MDVLSHDHAVTFGFCRKYYPPLCEGACGVAQSPVHDSMQAPAQGKTWGDKWRAIVDHFEDRDIPRGVIALNDPIDNLLRRFGDHARVPQHESEFLQVCHEHLDALLDLLGHPDVLPDLQAEILKRLMSDIGDSRSMRYIANCLGDAVHALGCIEGGWDGNKALYRQITAKEIAKTEAESMISIPSEASDEQKQARLAQRAYLTGPLSNEIMNLLSDRYGLRKSDQEPTGHAGTDNPHLQLTLRDTQRKFVSALTPYSVSSNLTADARKRFEGHLVARIKTMALFGSSRDAEQVYMEAYTDAAKAVSKQMCGNEDALKTSSFFLKKGAYLHIADDTAALRFDILAHMYSKGDLHGEPIPLGMDSRNDDIPYALVTDKRTVWKVASGTDGSWATLRSKPVEQATLAEFCAMEHDLSDQSIPYGTLIGSLIKRELRSDASGLDCIPATFFEYGDIATDLVLHLPRAALRARLTEYFDHMQIGLERAKQIRANDGYTRGMSHYIHLFKDIGQKLGYAVLLDCSPQHFDRADLYHMLTSLQLAAKGSAYVKRYKSQIMALELSAEDKKLLVRQMLEMAPGRSTNKIARTWNPGPQTSSWRARKTISNVFQRVFSRHA